MVLLTQLFISCISTEKSVKTIIRNYDTEKATRFLVDSCILKSQTDFLSSVLGNKICIDKIEEAIRVIPVLNKMLRYAGI